MKDVDLPEGPRSRLVRGFAACLSAVTETPLADLPPLTGDEVLAHALGAWKSWLACRNPLDLSSPSIGDLHVRALVLVPASQQLVTFLG